MVTQNLTMVRGDTFQFKLKLQDVTATIGNIVFSCKKRAVDTNYVFRKTLGDGVTPDGTDPDSYIIRVAPVDTLNVSAGKYVYDLEVTMGQDVYTLLMGNLSIIQDVTEN